jgi:hypothetical protein
MPEYSKKRKNSAKQTEGFDPFGTDTGLLHRDPLGMPEQLDPISE